MAQEPVFSQYYSSSLYLNPALAGIEKETTFGANYRSQWSKLVLPFNTFQFSFIQPVFQRGARKTHRGGAGISILNDVAGPSREFTSQAISISGAYNLYLGNGREHAVSVAIQTGARQHAVNYDDLRWTSQYNADMGFDPGRTGESFANIRVFQPVLGTGIMWSFTPSKGQTTFYQGMAIANLLRTQSYFDNEPGRSYAVLKVHGGFTFNASESLEISPNYLFQQQGINRQVNAGLYAGYGFSKLKGGSVKLTLGGWYRFGDALIASAGIVTERIAVAFSFDSNVSSLARTFGNAHANELSMTYRLPTRNNFKRISSPLI
jgi:type IX secretion system PorP/SprF family membrane protein